LSGLIIQLLSRRSAILKPAKTEFNKSLKTDAAKSSRLLALPFA
jgi:hypothetical protein